VTILAKKNTRDEHNKVTTQFIDLANQLKDKGHDIELIAAALMSASGIYTTYTVAGDQGYLQPAGVDKVAARYKENLAYIQEVKKATAKAS
jgi:hypothetical protein